MVFDYENLLLFECCLIWTWRILGFWWFERDFGILDGKWGNEVMFAFKTTNSVS